MQRIVTVPWRQLSDIRPKAFPKQMPMMTLTESNWNYISEVTTQFTGVQLVTSLWYINMVFFLHYAWGVLLRYASLTCRQTSNISRDFVDNIIVLH